MLRDVKVIRIGPDPFGRGWPTVFYRDYSVNGGQEEFYLDADSWANSYPHIPLPKTKGEVRSLIWDGWNCVVLTGILHDFVPKNSKQEAKQRKVKLFTVGRKCGGYGTHTTTILGHSVEEESDKVVGRWRKINFGGVA